MILLTDAIKKILPPLYSTENVHPDEKEIIVRFFNPLGNQSWEICEGEEEDGDWRLFGNCDLGFGMPELGYVMLSELESVSVGLGLKIERDICVGDISLHPEWS
jgi:hypothetical protein